MTIKEYKMTSAIILGAGYPYNSGKDRFIKKAFKNGNVLEWIINALQNYTDNITLLTGNEKDQIETKYFGVEVKKNIDWENTGSVYSFLQSQFHPEHKAIVTYGDIVFNKTAVDSLLNEKADIVIAVDSVWRDRYAGRPKDDLAQAEKVSIINGQVTSLGYHLDLNLATHEFVGLTYFSSKILSFIETHKSEYIDSFRKSNFSELIERLRIHGFNIKYVDLLGNWAELNDPQDLARFILGTKAETLHRLRPMVSKCKIEDQISFTVKKWERNNLDIINEIQEKFVNHKLVIRSSALSEDGFDHSNAGAYTSLLNIENTAKEIIQAINTVIASYPDNNPENQVLVQPMLEDVLASGVVFTKNITSGAPYYTVNYDDTTGSTESITSGTSKEHKTLIVHRDTGVDNTNIPDIAKPLIPALKEIESLLNYDTLDIEFAITANEGLHILQVRPLTTKNTNNLNKKSMDLEVIKENFFSTKYSKTSPFILGQNPIFGIMPDWNPAEIIGIKPKKLSKSLYKKLIMDDVWALQRSEYGYKNIRPAPLLQEIAGQPYVDVRASFNSFIPASIDNKLAEKLVNNYTANLTKNPHLHDKVEFDIVPTCYGFGFNKWKNKICIGDISEQEFDLLSDGLKEITNQAIHRNPTDFKHLELLQKRYKAIEEQNIPNLRKAYLLLEDCKKYGSLPFAHLARSGFVAVTLLKTAVEENIISQHEMDDFLNSIQTVSHELTFDAQKTAKGDLNWHAFVKKYGHLRPGTYEITSLNYASDPEHYLRPIIENTPTEVVHDGTGMLWSKILSKFNNALNEIGIKGSETEINDFLRSAIEGREYAKFIFTKNLSLAMELIAEWGEKYNVSRENLAHLSIDDIFSLQDLNLTKLEILKWVKERGEEAKAEFEKTNQVELPPLITKSDDITAFLIPDSQANFVGTKKIIAECVDISKLDNQAEIDIKSKIALIPQADPGYDWLFGNNIGGLITMYGGANSHMAIRSAEFNLPAAIGVGQKQYEALFDGAILELDPSNRIIRVIR